MTDLEGIQDLSREGFKSLLHQAADIILDLYDDVGAKKVYRSQSQEEVHALFAEDLPDTGTQIEGLLQTLQKDIIPNVALHYSPHFYAWVTSSATQASILGEMLASALNVNATTWLNAPAASELEQRVIRWIVEFIGYDPEANGVLVSGGSLSNFTALRVAIAQKCPYHYAQVGFDKNRALRIYASEQAHFCIERAIGSLGLGMENLVKIRVDKHFRIDLQHLREHIEMDLSEGRIPLAVVGNAGTVNTGAVDPINELSAVCKAYGLWLHLDAAYGGFAASIPKRREQEFAGMDLADSITIDLHKWLFVPFECGALLMKNPNHLRDTFRMVPEYQRFDHEDSKVDFSEWSMQQSRSFKALKVWMNFKAYGAEPLRQSIRSSLEWMQSLGKMIEASNDFELITPVSLSVVCFRYRSPENDLDLTALNRLNKAIVEDSEQDERVFIRETTIRGQTVLRACCTNFRREKKHLQYLLAVLREFGRRNLHRLGI